MARQTIGISIPEINNVELQIDIVGTTPLLIKDFDAKTLNDIADGQKGIAKAKKQPRNPRDEFNRARIRNAKGKDCVRGIWFKKAMSSMGGYFGIPRGNVEQGVYVVGDLIEFKSSPPTMRSDRVRVGQGPQAKTSIAYRPEFKNWRCRLNIGFDSSVITPHQVISLLAHAGMKNGVGEWRPQKGGDFGRFTVFPAGASKKLLAESEREMRQLASGKEEKALKRGAGRPRKALPERATVANKVVRRGKGK